MANPQTVVDYAAWEKGYMPPTEHILIDQLSYRGARVVLGSDWGDMAVWIVMRGKTPTPAMRKAMREMLNLFLSEDDELRTTRPTGFYDSLSPEQKAAAIAYTGDDTHGE